MTVLPTSRFSMPVERSFLASKTTGMQLLNPWQQR